MKKTIFILFYLIVIALSIKSLREPDLWWQIRTGQWILEHRQVPQEDVFSYTMKGAEWINIKWGFEVVAAVFSNAFGPESVFIIQALVSCLILFFLFKLSRLFIQRNYEKEDLRSSKTFLFSSAIAFLITFIAVEYRMIGRPEMVSHLMTVVFIYLLEKNKQVPSKRIFLLIPLQMIWANFHEAFAIGIVILLIYTVSAWISELFFSEKNLPKKKSGAFLLTLITLGAIASVAINPNGLALLTRPFNILSQVYSNKFTSELLDFTAQAWWKKEAYLGLLLFVIGLVGLLSYKVANAKVKESFFKGVLKNLNSGYVLVVFAFLYLSLTAYRNLIFLSLISFPAFHLSLFSFLRKRELKFPKLAKFFPQISVVLLIIFYVLIVSNQYYSLAKSRDRFGLEVLSDYNPVGAADFIKNNGLKEKKCFSDYLTSSYLLWKLQPDFKTYIDLRDLDVFPPEFFTRFFSAINYPEEFFVTDTAEHFDYVVLYQGQFSTLHSYLYNDSIYAPKYVDAVAAVYEKTDNFSREDIFSDCKPVKAGFIATMVNKILNPFYQTVKYSEKEDDYIAASYYINVERLDLAAKRAEACIKNDKRSFKGYEMMGKIYYKYGLREATLDKRKEYFSMAEQSYWQSLQIKKNYTPSLVGWATVQYDDNNYTGALDNLKKCLDIDDEKLQAHLLSAECYKALLKINESKWNEYSEEILKHYIKANSLNPGSSPIETELGFAYYRLKDCKRAVKFLTKTANDKNMSEEVRRSAGNCLKECNQ